MNTKSHVIDIFTSEDMENISLCIPQYLTLYNKMPYVLLVKGRVLPIKALNLRKNINKNIRYGKDTRIYSLLIIFMLF